MSGGHVKLKQRGTGSAPIEQIDPKERETLIRSLHALRTSISKKNDEIEGNQLKRKRFDDKIKELKRDLNEVITTADSSIKELELRKKKNIEIEKNTSNTDNATLRERELSLQNSLKALEIDLPEIEREAKKAENEMAVIADEIEGCGGPDMTSLREELKSVKKEHQSIKRDVVNKKSEKGKLEIARKDIEESVIPHLEDQRQQALNNIDSYEEAMKKNMDDALKVDGNINQLKELEAEKSKDLENVTNELRKLNGENEQHAADEQRFKETFDHLMIESKKYGEIIARHQKEFDREIRAWKDLPDLKDLDILVDSDEQQQSSVLAITNDNENNEGKDLKLEEWFFDPDRSPDLSDIEKFDLLTIDIIAGTNQETIEIEIQKAKLQLERHRDVDLTLFDEYRRIALDYSHKCEEHKHVEAAYVKIKDVLNALEGKRFRLFCEGFHIIATHLKVEFHD